MPELEYPEERLEYPEEDDKGIAEYYRKEWQAISRKYDKLLVLFWVVVAAWFLLFCSNSILIYILLR